MASLAAGQVKFAGLHACDEDCPLMLLLPPPGAMKTWP